MSGSQGSSGRDHIDPIYQPSAVVAALANQVQHRDRQEQEFLNRMQTLSSEQVKVQEQQKEAESQLAKMREELEEAKRDRDYARAKLDLEDSKRKLDTANSELQRINEAMEAEMVRSESFRVAPMHLPMLQPDGDLYPDLLDSPQSDMTYPIMLDEHEGTMFADFGETSALEMSQPVFMQQPDGRLVQIGDPQAFSEPLFQVEPDNHQILYDDDTLLYRNCTLLIFESFCLTKVWF